MLIIIIRCYLCKNIGEILVNSENNWVFKPNHAINYLTDSFGLSSFNSPQAVS